jgi:hypothetical protein
MISRSCNGQNELAILKVLRQWVWTVRSSTATRMWTYVSVCPAKLVKLVVFLIGNHNTQIYTRNINYKKQNPYLKSGVTFKDLNIIIYTKNNQCTPQCTSYIYLRVRSGFCASFVLYLLSINGDIHHATKFLKTSPWY